MDLSDRTLKQPDLDIFSSELSDGIFNGDQIAFDEQNPFEQQICLPGLRKEESYDKFSEDMDRKHIKRRYGNRDKPRTGKHVFTQEVMRPEMAAGIPGYYAHKARQEREDGIRTKFIPNVIVNAPVTMGDLAPKATHQSMVGLKSFTPAGIAQSKKTRYNPFDELPYLRYNLRPHSDTIVKGPSVPPTAKSGVKGSLIDWGRTEFEKSIKSDLDDPSSKKFRRGAISDHIGNMSMQRPQVGNQTELSRQSLQSRPRKDQVINEALSTKPAKQSRKHKPGESYQSVGHSRKVGLITSKIPGRKPKPITHREGFKSTKKQHVAGKSMHTFTKPKHSKKRSESFNPIRQSKDVSDKIENYPSSMMSSKNLSRGQQTRQIVPSHDRSFRGLSTILRETFHLGSGTDRRINKNRQDNFRNG